MGAGLAVPFALIGLFLIAAGIRMSQRGKTEGERLSGLFCVCIGALFLVGAILLAAMAL